MTGDLLAAYWWMLALPFAIWLYWRSVRTTSRGYWVFLLRITGAILLLTTAVWPITGNIDRPGMHLAIGGWPQEIMILAIGCVALYWAGRIAHEEVSR